VLNDNGITKDLLRRACSAGIDVVVVTVDLPVPAKRERDVRNRFTLPLRPDLKMAWDVITHPSWAVAMFNHGVPQFANLVPYAPRQQLGTQSLASFMAAQLSPSVTWEVIDQIRADWPGQLLVKGILSAADAKAAVDHGVNGLVVSNHGGRQLDAAPATLDTLPAIADVIAGRIPLLFDGGIRRGLDIAKSIALGADFALVGRAPLYGAGAGGAAGVARALDLLEGELATALGQLGCPNVPDLRNLERGQRKPSLGS
jgi:(S)-mandelate dehydrogenase